MEEITCPEVLMDLIKLNHDCFFFLWFQIDQESWRSHTRLMWPMPAPSGASPKSSFGGKARSISWSCESSQPTYLCTSLSILSTERSCVSRATSTIDTSSRASRNIAPFTSRPFPWHLVSVSTCHWSWNGGGTNTHSYHGRTRWVFSWLVYWWAQRSDREWWGETSCDTLSSPMSLTSDESVWESTSDSPLLSTS